MRPSVGSATSRAADAPLLVIAGPTAVGKTAAAVALASVLPIEVVSADSRQVYRGMDAATGKPTPSQRAAVPHHVIDVADPGERYHAARFVADAEAAITAIGARGRLPAVVGGTGLYLRALLGGLEPAPAADLGFRAEMDGIARREGRAALHRHLTELAPEHAARLHPNDSVRVIRALERLRTGGSPPGDQARWRAAGERRARVYVVLHLPPQRLTERVAARAAVMARSGLREEVAQLLSAGSAPTLAAFDAIGYREFAAVLRGELDEEAAVARMQQRSAAYARRQLTWFRREPGCTWIDVDGEGGVARAVEEIVRLLAAAGVRA